MVRTPCSGGMVVTPYFTSVMELAVGCHLRGMRFTGFLPPNDSLIARARNTVAAEFLKSDCSHLLFIDADIQFNPRDAIRLLMAHKDIVGRVYSGVARSYGLRASQLFVWRQRLAAPAAR